MKWFFTRFKDSIIHPKEIAKFRFDHFGLVLLYFIIIILIAGIFSPIKIIMFKELSDSQKTDIIRYARDLDDVNCSIQNYELVCNSSTPSTFTVGALEVVFKGDVDYDVSSDSTVATTVLLDKDNISIYYAGTVLGSYSYKDLPQEFNGLDFSNFTDITNTDFWNPFFSGVESLISQNRVMFAVSFGLVNYIQIIINMGFTLLFLSLLMAIFNARGAVTFLQSVKMTAYSMTAYSVLLLIVSILGVVISPFFEILIIVIYANLALSNIKMQMFKGGSQ